MTLWWTNGQCEKQSLAHFLTLKRAAVISTTESPEYTTVLMTGINYLSHLRVLLFLSIFGLVVNDTLVF